MKKNLFIFFSFISISTYAEIDYTDILESIQYYQDSIRVNTDVMSSDVLSIRDNVDVLYDDILGIKNIMESSLVGEYSIPQYLQDIRIDLDDFRNYVIRGDLFYKLEELNNYILEYLSDFIYNGIKVILPEDYSDQFSPYFKAIYDGLSGLQTTFNGYHTTSEISNSTLSDILDAVNKLLDDSTEDEKLTEMTISSHILDNFGLDIDVENASSTKFSTSGEFNKDVHQLLICLNEISSSENYALLSILTNVQYLVSTFRSSADISKVEEDITSRGYSVDSANQQLSQIENQNWDSFFTPPTFLSDVYDNLQITVNSSELPRHIMIIDTFHFDSEAFTCEISDVGFDLPNSILDLVEYARTVFAFVYWTLTLFIAFFFLKLWYRLYSYVINCLIRR